MAGGRPKPKYNRKNILTGQASIYVCAYDFDAVDLFPDIPELTDPINTVWDGPWVPIGATDDGLQLAFERATDDIMVEEQVTPVDVTTKSVDMNWNITCSEATLETMRIACGGGSIVAHAATSLLPAYRELILSSDLEHYIFGFEGMAPPAASGNWRRVVVPEVISASKIKAAFRRSKEPQKYETSLRTICELEDVFIQEYVSPPTP